VSPGQGDNAGVIAPPPLIFAVPLGAGLYVDRLHPFPIMPRLFAEWLGGALIVVAIVLSVAAVAQFWRKHTSMIPQKPTTAIIQSGPFRITRNPLYLSMILLYVGIALVMNTVWPLLLLPLVLLIMHRGVILREERYLEQKFGDEYISYRSRVRRWL
jgi:protein-S-isoprenylcysteine O-methyltransferase Ste14